MMRTGAVITLAFAMLVLGGCAAAAGARQAAPTTTPPPDYLARSADIGAPGSWAIDADLAAGTLYEVQLTGTGESEQVLSAEGTLRLRRSHLKVEAGLPKGATDLLGTGTYVVGRRGATLRVAVPARAGRVRTYDFHPDSGTAYNVIVSRLDSTAQQALAAARQQQADRQQRQQAEAAQLEAQAAQACSAVGGHIQGQVAAGSGGLSMEAYCAADPTRTWEDPASSNRPRADPGEAITCSGLSVPFNDDGTLDLGALQSTEWNYPGCFG